MRLLQVLVVLSSLIWGTLQAAGTLFVLVGTDEIRQYRVGAGEMELEVSYGAEAFPKLFPIERIKVERGNIIRCYGQERAEKGLLLYDFSTGRLAAYDGNPGNPSDPRGKVLAKPASYAGRWRQGDRVYADFFTLEGKVFGVGGGRVQLLPDLEASSRGELETVFSSPGKRSGLGRGKPLEGSVPGRPLQPANSAAASRWQSTHLQRRDPDVPAQSTSRSDLQSWGNALRRKRGCPESTASASRIFSLQGNQHRRTDLGRFLGRSSPIVPGSGCVCFGCGAGTACGSRGFGTPQAPTSATWLGPFHPESFSLSPGLGHEALRFP